MPRPSISSAVYLLSFTIVDPTARAAALPTRREPGLVGAAGTRPQAPETGAGALANALEGDV
jgi:hypothetical protein